MDERDIYPVAWYLAVSTHNFNKLAKYTYCAECYTTVGNGPLTTKAVGIETHAAAGTSCTLYDTPT